MIAEANQFTRQDILDGIDIAERMLFELAPQVTPERVTKAATVIAGNAVAIMGILTHEDFKTMHAALMALQLSEQITRLSSMEASD